jgi:hypothetical protein
LKGYALAAAAVVVKVVAVGNLLRFACLLMLMPSA